MVASVLRRGQVAVIQVDSEDSDDPHVVGLQNMQRDSISFMLLAPVGSGTVIYFTDRTWNGTTFAGAGGGEGTYAWTAGADMAAGTIITINEAELTAAGIELLDTGETIYVYQGTDANTPTTFLQAIEYGDGNTTFNANLTNTGLTVGASAVALAADNVTFGERTWNHQADILFTNINTTANWSGNENSPHTDAVEGTNGHVAPDVQLWIAGISGGHGLFSVNADTTQNGGLGNGYNVGHHFQNTANDGDATTFTQRFWSPTHILFDTVAGKFFVVDSSGSHDRVLQGNISDLLNNPGTAPTMTILWQDSPAGVMDSDGITSIQLDKASGHVYFTASNDLLRVNYDSANQTATQLLEFGDDEGGNPNFVNELVLDLANNRAFVIQTESFSDFIESPPGSGNFVVGTVMYQNSIHLISNLASGDTGIGNNTELQLNFAGGYHDADNPFGNQLNEFDNALGRITDVEINTATGEIWFTAVQINAGTNGEVGGIYRATLSGGTLTVTTIHSETNATNRNYTHIHVDEETGFYYVSSVEPGQSGNHSVYRGSLGASAGTAPTLFATVGNINEMTPRDMTLESAPTLSGTAIAALGVTEQTSAPNSAETARVTLFSGLTASDIDTSGGDELVGATVRISSGFVNEASTVAGHTTTVDILRLNGDPAGTISGINFSYNSTTGVMTLTGAATVAEYAAALALVQFSTTGDNVTNDGTSTSRTIAVSVFDGLLHSDELTNTVTVTGINDRPVNTVGAAMNFTEDTTGVITPGTPVNAITGISVADADADPATHDITVTLSVNAGTLDIRTDVVGGLAAGEVTGNGTGTLVLTGTQNQINATLAAVNGSAQANGLVYTPPTNVNGQMSLTIVTNDQGFSGNDPGQTGTGTTEEDSDVKIINVAAVNDAPIVAGDGTEALADILEDQPGPGETDILTLLGGQYSDAADNQVVFTNGSSPGAFSGIAVVSSGSSASGEWQWFNTGTATWTNIGAATSATARLYSSTTEIRFNPTLDFNGAAPTLTVHLIDNSLGFGITNNQVVNISGGGATGGTTAYSAGTVVLSQTIIPVNDAPTSTSLSGDTATFTEGAASVAVDVGGNATIGDVDSANFDTGSLTVAITAGGVAAQDELLIATAGGITSDATTVSFGGTQIGTHTGGSGGTALVFTFDADATPAAVQALVRAIRYTNSNVEDPTDGNRTLTWTLVDGDGTLNSGVDTLTVTTTVDVDPVNDEPAGGDETIVLNEDDAHAFSLTDFNFSDTADGDSLLLVVITTLPATGDLYLNGVAITVAGTAISATDIDNGLLTFEPDPNTHGIGYATFTFQVRDDGGIADGGVDTDASPNTMTIDVTALNDAPVNVVGATVNATEDDVNVVLSTIGAEMSVSDVEATGDIVYSLSVSNGTLTIRTDVVGGIQASDIQVLAGTGNGTAVINIAATVSQINTTLAASNGLLYTPDADFFGTDTLDVYANDGGQTGLDTNPASLLEADSPGIGAATEEDFDQRSIIVVAADDAGVAVDDPGNSTNENATVNIAVLTNDSDIDSPLSVAQVNGAAIAVGGTVALASGATVTLEANGTLTYNPNGEFDHLIAAATQLATQAVNDSASDSFTYALSDGDTATVSVTVNGVTSAGDQLRGDAGNNTINGTAAGNLFHLGQGGEDTVTGLNGRDLFYFGAQLSTGDSVNGGGGPDDQLGIQGNYGAPFVLGANHLVNIETLALMSGSDDRFGDTSGNFYSYNIATVDANVDAGARLTVNFNTLRVGENVIFDGSDESDGAFLTYGGLGNDTLVGGDQSDWFYFGNLGRWGAGDSVVGGAGADDQVGLQGSYTVGFGAGQLVGIESLALMTGGDGRFGNPPGTGYVYDITMDDGNVAALGTMVVNANTLRSDVPGISDETLTFDGSAETDGRFIVYSGAGDDSIVGSAGDDLIYGAGGADTLTGGAGNDTFAYMNAAHSTAADMDQLLDFSLGDKISLTSIDAVPGGANDAFAFIGTAAFAGVAGQLRVEDLGGGAWQAQADLDGDTFADFVIGITAGHILTSSDFFL